jgi:hypothetical protein
MIYKTKILGAVTVTSAGTRVQLTASDIAAYAVLIQANPANTGNIFVGDSTVSSSNGAILEPGDFFVVEPDISEEMDEVNLSDIYIDAATNNDSVRVQYMTVRGS